VKPHLLVTLLLGGVAALDATPVAQTLLSQPLVSACILGWVWGDFDLALKVGVVLQILAASTLPVGARTPEDYAAGGVIGVATALMLAEQQPFQFARDGCALLGALFGMVAAVGGVPLLKWQRRANEGLSRWCEATVLRGDEGALGRAQLAAVVLAFGIGVTYAAVCLALGLWGLRSVASHESIRLSRAWTVVQPVWLGLGLAQLLNAFVQRRLTRAAVFFAAVVVAWLVLLVGAP
jgi:mannose/fructose/N-acetylgalactosamine-specific phosphotransferase system component IIC